MLAPPVISVTGATTKPAEEVAHVDILRDGVIVRGPTVRRDEIVGKPLVMYNRRAGR